MNGCHAKVNLVSSIGTNYPNGDQHMEKLMKDTFRSCERYGAYKVRIAALKQMEGNSGALNDVDLAAYTSNYEDFLHISNMAHIEMTPEERHHEFCLNHKIEFRWPLNWEGGNE